MESLGPAGNLKTDSSLRTWSILLCEELDLPPSGESRPGIWTACILCGEAGDLVEYKGKKVCWKCIDQIK